MRNLSGLALLTTLLGITSCGRDVSESTSTSSNSRRSDNVVRIDPILQDRFEREEVNCLQNEDCHASVAKVIVNDKGTLRSCSGVLIAEDLILTSASCLGRSYRHSGVSCTDHLYTVFPETTSWKVERHFCKGVVSASSIRLSQDVALRRADIAIYRIGTSSERPVVEISRDGVQDGRDYTVVGFKKEVGKKSFQKQQTCRPAYGSYSNPFAQNLHSPMQLFKNCQFHFSGRGGAVLDDQGRVAAIVSSGQDNELLDFLRKSLKIRGEANHHLHASNLSCMDEKAPVECFKAININLLDYYRSRMLSSKRIHQENIQEAILEREWPSKYFQWTVDFLASEVHQGFEAFLGRPKCFNQLQSWINEFSRGGRGRTIYTWAKVKLAVPLIRLISMLDENLMPISVLEGTGEHKSIEVTFKPADAFFRGSSDLTLKGELFGKPLHRQFSSIPTTCH